MNPEKRQIANKRLQEMAAGLLKESADSESISSAAVLIASELTLHLNSWGMMSLQDTTTFDEAVALLSFFSSVCHQPGFTMAFSRAIELADGDPSLIYLVAGKVYTFYMLLGQIDRGGLVELFDDEVRERFGASYLHDLKGKMLRRGMSFAKL